MKQLDSIRRGEFIAPPLFIVAVIFSIAGGVFAAEPASNRAAEHPEKIVLTIDQAIHLAMQTNRNIANSQYSAESQRYSIDAARALFDLKLIPAGGISLTGGNNTDYNSISAGLQLQKKLESGTSVAFGPQIVRSSGQSTQQYTTDIGVTVTQPLLRGMGKEVTTDSVKSADAGYKTALRNVYQTKVNTVLETIATFYDAIRQMEMLQLFEKMAVRLNGHSEIARAKEKVGLATPMDTYRSEISRMEVEEAMISAREALHDAQDRLKFILALPQTTELEVAPPEETDLRELPLDDAIKTALDKRIEIEQMEQDLSEAQRNAAIMKHNLLPELNLVLGYSRYATAESMGESSDLDLDRYSVSLQTVTDMVRRAEKAAYQQSLIGIKMLSMNVESQKEEIRRQVRKQWLALQEAVKRVEIRKAQIEQGEGKIALAEVKFAHGMADNFDVIEAEKELQSARSNLVAAKIDYALGLYNMKVIMGELVPRD